MLKVINDDKLAKVSGRVPENTFDLSHNQLNGSFPKSFALMTRIAHLHVGGNHFTGTLPSAYGNWTRLQSFHVFENDIDGTGVSGVAGVVIVIVPSRVDQQYFWNASCSVRSMALTEVV